MAKGGMHGERRACMMKRVCEAKGGVHGKGGHVWQRRGMCGKGGVHGEGGGGVCVGYNEIRSMRGRYASYWNAFWF